MTTRGTKGTRGDEEVEAGVEGEVGEVGEVERAAIGRTDEARGGDDADGGGGGMGGRRAGDDGPAVAVSLCCAGCAEVDFALREPGNSAARALPSTDEELPCTEAATFEPRGAWQDLQRAAPCGLRAEHA